MKIAFFAQNFEKFLLFGQTSCCMAVHVDCTANPLEDDPHINHAFPTQKKDPMSFDSLEGNLAGKSHVFPRKSMFFPYCSSK